MKKISLVYALLAFMLVLAGCGAQQATTGSGAGSDSASDPATTADAFKNSRPQRRADVNGTVKTVVGNDFTVETIDITSNPILSQQIDPAKMQTMSDTERQAYFQQMQDARKNAKKILVDVTIPVGIPVYVRAGRGGGFGGGGFGGRGGNQSTAGGLGASLAGGSNPTNTQRSGSGSAMGTGKQGTIADIKVGNQIQIWLMTGSDDRKIAEWVSTSPARTPGQGGGNGGGNGGGGFGGGGAPRG